ncbi:MAG: T9SS type A sorting domain-containing protein [Ignavibacteria bacterium]|nr:T9SS type A sorting domain-containing protein [Ignavibacteria bacterium]
MKTINKMSLKIVTIIMMFLCISTGLISQPAQMWVNSYNGINNTNDRAFRSVVDAAGNLYVLGTTFNAQTKDDIVLIKYNQAGVQQWAKIYAGEVDADDMPEDIVIDAQGNVFCAVYNQSSVGQNPHRIIVLKYNPSGTLVWIFENTPIDNYKIPTCLTVANDGYIYVAGKFLNGNQIQPYFVKINPNGTLNNLGYLPFTADNYSSFFDIIADNFGNVYLTGSYKNNIVTCKFNTACDTVWTRSYKGTANGIIAGDKICFDESFNILVGGSVMNTGTSYDFCVIKYNNFGVQQWVRTYNGSGSGADILKDMVVGSDGSVYLTGRVYNGVAGNDIATCRINQAGNLFWTNLYNGAGNGNDWASSIALDNAGALYVGGTSNEGSNGTDYTVIKYSTLLGNMHWAAHYSLSTSDTLTSMVLDNNYNVLISGHHKRFLNSDRDFGIYKLGSTIGIQQMSNEIPAQFELYQNYPNPFNPTTNIKLQIPESGLVKLVVFDVTGREVAELVNETLGAGEYKVDFNASGLTSGVYFYRLEAEGFSEIKKMILVK